MDTQLLWYGSALLLGPLVGYYLARYFLWQFCLDLPLVKRLTLSALSGFIYSILAFPFIIDLGRQPINEAWGLALLANSVTWPVLAVMVREYGWELRLWRDD